MKENMTTKNLKYLGLVLILAVSALVAAPRPAVAGNEQDVMSAFYDQSEFSEVVRGGQTSSNMARLYYTGSSTECVATITSSNITFYAPAGTADTGIGSSGVINLTAAAYDTMGELCDYINGKTNYRCVLTGALRSDASGGASAVIMTQTATTGTCDLKGKGGCALTNYDAGMIRLGILPSQGKRVILKGIQAVSVETTNNVYVYGIPRKSAGGLSIEGAAVTHNSEQWRSATGSTSLVYIPASSQYQLAPWMEFNDNAQRSVNAQGRVVSPPVGSLQTDGRVVIALGVLGGTSQTQSQYIRVFWSEK